MYNELFPQPSPVFASTRKEALDQLNAFIPAAGRYANHRNHVLPGHTNVSRLSPAIRHRLILESECAAAPIRRYAASTIEKIFAGWWIHIEKLPWQLGADFFYRHLLDGDPASNMLSWRWVAENQVQQIAAMRPEIGPLHDQIHRLQKELSYVGIDLILFDRPEDLVLRPFATGGFFGFWEKTQKSLKAEVLPNAPF